MNDLFGRKVSKTRLREAKAYNLNEKNMALWIRFDRFWDAWPKGYKVGKMKCWKRWQVESPDAGEYLRIMVGLERWKQSERWHEGYICNPITFLNQRRWEDEPKPKSEFDRPRGPLDSETELSYERLREEVKAHGLEEGRRRWKLWKQRRSERIRGRKSDP